MWPVKPAIFHPAALQSIREFPDEIKRAMGEAILKLQYGVTLTMPLSRPMPSVASGVAELRVKDRSGVYRTFYYARRQEGVLILHAFVKKTQTTPDREIALARRRLRELTHETN